MLLLSSVEKKFRITITFSFLKDYSDTSWIAFYSIKYCVLALILNATFRETIELLSRIKDQTMFLAI